MIHLKLVNLEEVYNSLVSEPLLLNDVTISNDEDRQNIEELLITKYKENQSTLSVPACD